MSIRITPWSRGGFLVDIRWEDETGKKHRLRKVLKTSHAAAGEWAKKRERYLIQHGNQQTDQTPAIAVPTFDLFWPRFVRDYVEANRQKPSEARSKDSIWRTHLRGPFGAMRLDEISTENVQTLKAALTKKAPKTVNNILTVLGTMLQQAVKWSLIAKVPCEIAGVKVPDREMEYYEEEDYESVVAAALEISHLTFVAVLLAGDAGLRAGEIRGLRWRDVDTRHHQLRIQQAEWRGHVEAPKGWQMRRVRMTERLEAALKAHKHLRHERVLVHTTGEPLTEKVLQGVVKRAIDRAKVAESARPIHRLRHTFGARLAMKGAPAKAIQILMGHKNLSTTQRYMHLSPSHQDQAIRLLDETTSGPRTAAKNVND